MSEARRIGKYEIQALIGKGSAAAVYRGSDGARPVALKIVNRNALGAEPLARLRQSAATLARVRHPAIVPFVELVEAGGALGFVWELAEGESLAARMKSARPDLRQTWEIARQLLEALEAAHAKGTFHGELRPSNLFLDKEGRLRVTDFGTAALAGAGTPSYMAPEQVSEGEITLRTDLYQVGAIVYHLVTGKLPFTGTREEIVHCILVERPADPSSFTPKLAWQLDSVIQRALAKDPKHRFGSAREFMDGLRLGLQESLGTPLPAPAPAPKTAPAVQPDGAPKPAPAGLTPEAVAAVEPALVPKDPPAAQPAPAAAPVVAPVAAPVAPINKLANAAKLIAKPAPAPANEALAEAAPRTRVLFVDDDERVINGLGALFRQEYEVFTADSGARALEIVSSSAIQIVVSDQRMPGMTGVELLREVRKVAPHTVRLLLTGYSDLAAMVGSINEGEVFRFVKKPWDNDEIRATLAEAAAIAAKLAPAAAKLAPAAAPVAGSPRGAGSLLVIDSGKTLAKGLERLLGGEATLQVATSPAEAVRLLQQHDIAAIVADLASGKEGLLKLFKLLKERRPEILSILVAKDPDAELVADLINQAHIYRFLAKPVDGRELRSHVSEALRRYASFKQSKTKESGLAQGVGMNSERLVSRSA